MWASKQTLTINRKKSSQWSLQVMPIFLWSWESIIFFHEISWIYSVRILSLGRLWLSLQSSIFKAEGFMILLSLLLFFLQEMHYGYYIVKYLPSVSIDFSNIEMHQWLSFSMLIHWLYFCLSMGLNSLKLG